MNNTHEGDNAWPFPKSDSSDEAERAEREPVDPLEQRLADENVRHDQKVTREIDSEISEEPTADRS